MGIERIITGLVAEWLVVGVGFIYDQVGVGVWREDVLMTTRKKYMVRSVIIKYD